MAYEVLSLDEANYIGKILALNKCDEGKSRQNTESNRTHSSSSKIKLASKDLESSSSDEEEKVLLPLRMKLKKKMRKLQKDQAHLKKMEDQIIKEEEGRKKLIEKWDKKDKQVTVNLLRKQFELSLKKEAQIEKENDLKLEKLERRVAKASKDSELKIFRDSKLKMREKQVEEHFQEMEKKRLEYVNKEIRLRDEFLQRREHNNKEDQILMQEIMEKIKMKLENAARKHESIEEEKFLSAQRQNKKVENVTKKAQVQLAKMSKENIEKIVSAEIKKEKAKLTRWSENLNKEFERQELKKEKNERMQELRQEFEKIKEERRTNIILTDQQLEKLIVEKKEKARQMLTIQNEMKNLVYQDRQLNLEISKKLTKQKIDKFIQKHREYRANLKSRKSYFNNLSLADHFFNTERRLEKERVLEVEHHLLKDKQIQPNHNRSLSASIFTNNAGRRVLKTILPTKYYEELYNQNRSYLNSRAGSSDR